MPKREDLDGYAIAVIIPCYNERQTIGKVIDDLRLALSLASIYVYDNGYFCYVVLFLPVGLNSRCIVD